MWPEALVGFIEASLLVPSILESLRHPGFYSGANSV